ncbi:unnamed protein product [Rotaria sp. Silwood1]|nr:unnamed protein product [Rotaria sp. Silwood1]CAF1542182.1 unnamed protein product [Rotaria sp. Silwood1]CAF3615508.1 unnamed protein product [Rotaria sp. Silwood1]CAF3722731.1 unnamed protein product [Rotaria sp. Silwood1]CAF4781377.1 unnamed protein product [Rotaria sp. Silwood1]
MTTFDNEKATEQASIANNDASYRLDAHYAPHPDYEGAHRYDTSATWTVKEEASLVRRIDFRITVWACVLICAMQLDRGNISQANSDNFLGDINITTNEFNYGQSIYIGCFVLAELPSQLISRRVGPDRWVPMLVMGWSLVAMCQSLVHDKISFYITRSFMGLLEGGFVPIAVLYLSYWYKTSELPTRLSFFWVGNYATNIVSSFLALGILKLRGHRGWPGWKYLFLIEGTLTFCVGVFTWFYLPASPTQTRNRFRKNGWFTEKEEIILVTRVLRDDPSKGDMSHQKMISPRELLRSLYDYDIWPLYILNLMQYIPMTPQYTYLTLNLRALGFSTFETNLLTMPVYVMIIVQLLLTTRIAKWIKGQRTFISMSAQFWSLPFLITMITLPDSTNHWVKYGITVGLLSYPYPQAIFAAWTSENSNSVRTRAVSIAINNIMVNLGSIAGSNIYRKDDAPNYRRGNLVCLVILSINIVLFLVTKIYFILRNQYHRRRWNAMTVQEQDAYLAANKHLGNKRFDFQFAH